METSESILEILEENAQWWEKAAAQCETLVQRASDRNRQELMSMVDLYKERAGIYARLAEHVRNGETPDPLFPTLSDYESLHK